MRAVCAAVRSDSEQRDLGNLQTAGALQKMRRYNDAVRGVDSMTKYADLVARLRNAQKLDVVTHVWRLATDAAAAIEDLEREAKLNTAMLAKQCDLAREAERRETNIREVLTMIADQCEDHPLYFQDATDEDLKSEGGDCATITSWAHIAREALQQG